MSTQPLTKGAKRKIFEEITKKEDFLGIYKNYDGILTFLTKVWPLHEMSSEDDRFKNAYEDARQHLVNNSDWDLTETFVNRFGLIDGPENEFIKFLEVVVSPEVRGSREQVLTYVVFLNELLKETSFRLIHTDFFEEIPLYTLVKGESDGSLPIELRSNKIPFFRGPDVVIEYPCFVIHYDNWDDYGIKTMVGLNYYTGKSDSHHLGRVKIMKRGENNTWELLPERFMSLDTDFCSLATSDDYYLDLKKLLPNQYQSVLYSLRDAALFPRIAEQFEDDSVFRTSLIRNNTAEKRMRTIRFKLNDIDISQAFKFNYQFQPPYSSEKVNINFDFQNEGEIKHRIFGLIGKNGSGKTRVLSSIVHSLSNDQPEEVSPKKPLYGKIFTLSYSFFDQFEIPEPNSSFNYVYCGLKKRGGGWLSEQELLHRFMSSKDKIVTREETKNWLKILSTFISEDILGELFEEDFLGRLSFSPLKFDEMYKKLSSGQSILLFVMTEVLAQIRFNSLILYDEPETHLHPNAISELMGSIFTLVDNYDSFCIIATHSPIVIQELQSRNIYVLERDEGAAIVRKLSKEAFGENLTVITEDIFGNRNIAKHYMESLSKLVKKGMSFDEIVGHLETDDIPLSLNARLYIKGLIAEKG